MLNVRSMDGAGRGRSDDLTTRARIRDAAILLFGRDGFERVSVRAIAAEVGVSAALVIHHFGSKDALRAACDQFILDELFDRKDLLRSPRMSEALQRWMADIDQFRPWIDYLGRMLIDPSPASQELFDAMLASTRTMLAEQAEAGTMRRFDDPEMTALLVTMSSAASLILSKQLTRTLGGDYFDPAIVRRMTLPTLDLYTHGLYTDDRLLRAAREALDRSAGPADGKGDNDPHQDPDPPTAAPPPAPSTAPPTAS